MPINAKVKGGDDWRDCLRESLDLLNTLQGAAGKLQGETDRYIRPILLVQVERTGRDQREGGFIHAADARTALLNSPITFRKRVVMSSAMITAQCSYCVYRRRSMSQSLDCSDDVALIGPPKL